MPKKSTASGDAIEKDAGYGESHGYPKSHGGPTGPGDAPAKPLPAQKTASKRTGASDSFDHDGRDSRRSTTTKKKTGGTHPKGGAHVDRSRTQ